MEAILSGQDPRLLVVVGPCSIHDQKAALDYARRLSQLAQELADRLFIVMRCYFEKPRTTVGWTGSIPDPNMDGSGDMKSGLRIARELLLEINALGLPAATEFLDPLVPQYIADLISWAAIGARTTESQTHRMMASGLSMPVGFKNSTDGNEAVAIQAILAARGKHTFLGFDEDGRSAIVSTTGNGSGHVVMRGGKHSPNYHETNIAAAQAALQKAGLPPELMVDCSHANSHKNHERQIEVCREVVRQRAAGNRGLIGLMIESNLFPGRQDIPPGLGPLEGLKYGVSVTDACISWGQTEKLLREAYDRLPGCSIAHPA